MVTPSRVRDIRDSTLLEIWRQAIEFLRTADQWVFAGYSFPREDVAIRSLILRAARGRDAPRHLSVIQHGASAEVRKQIPIDVSQLRLRKRGNRGNDRRCGPGEGSIHRARSICWCAATKLECQTH